MKPRILFIVPSDYSDLSTKGVAAMMSEREEQGYFERVVTVHPWASHTRVIDVSPVHRLYEMHESIGPIVGKFKLLRYPYHLWHVIRLVRMILKIIDEEKPSILRATDPFYTGFLAWIVTRFRPLPTCISIHADYDKRYELDGPQSSPTILNSRRAAQMIEGFTLRRAALVLPIRQSLVEKAHRYGVPDSRIRVIPHGLDMSDFSTASNEDVRSALELPREAHILSFVGRLAKDNYVDDLLTLAGALQKQRSDFVIVVAGDGPERAALAERLQREGLSRIVRLIGFRTHTFVIALRKQSAVSLCLMGGFSLIEACAAGSPVVAYDVEWHSELVQTGKTGRLVRERDIPGLVDSVNDLLNHPKEAQAMGAAAKALAFERHDILKTSAVKRRYYDELLTGRTRD